MSSFQSYHCPNIKLDGVVRLVRDDLDELVLDLPKDFLGSFGGKIIMRTGPFGATPQCQLS